MGETLLIIPASDAFKLFGQSVTELLGLDRGDPNLESPIARRLVKVMTTREKISEDAARTIIRMVSEKKS